MSSLDLRTEIVNFLTGKKQKDVGFNSPIEGNFINSMIQQASNIGYQRSNKFIAIIHGPKVEAQTKGPQAYYNPLISPQIIDVYKKSNFDMKNPLDIETKKRLALNCNNISFPGKELLTQEFTPIGSGPVIKFPYAENFAGKLEAEFLCGADSFERKYFIGWQQSIIDSTTHDVELYENYAKKWKILIVLLPTDISNFNNIAGAFAAQDKNLTVYTEGKSRGSPGQFRNLYYVRVNEVYPLEINETALGYDQPGQIFRISVKFAYKYWDDPVVVYNDSITRLKELGLDNDRIASDIENLSPWAKFNKIVGTLGRYANPNELKQLIIDSGLGYLNETFGVETIENLAGIGQNIAKDGLFGSTNRTVKKWNAFFDNI